MAEDAQNTEQQGATDSPPSNPPTTSFSNIDDALNAAIAAAEQEGRTEEGAEGAKTGAESSDAETPPTSGLDQVDEGDDDKPVYSRKAAAQYYEKMKEADAKAATLQAQLDEQKKEQESLNSDVLKALGLDGKYEEAKRSALDTRLSIADRNQAAELVKVFEANQGFFGKLQKVAERAAIASVAKKLSEAADQVEGADKQIVLGDDIGRTILHIRDVTRASVEKAKDAEITQLKAELAGAKKLAKSGGTSILSGGSSGGDFDLSSIIDPKTGALSDEFEQLALSGALRG